jgi:hypothetical protein
VARQPVTFFLQQKKVTKKCRKLAKFDLEITYSLWDIFIQYTLAAHTRIIFTGPNCSSKSKLPSSQYHSDTSGFSKHNEATTNKFSRLLFILEQVKIVPNGRFLLLSSAYRSKGEKRVELLFCSKRKLYVKLDTSAAQKSTPYTAWR